MIIKFTDEEYIRGHHHVDLGREGDFYAELLEVDPESWPDGRVKAQGTWRFYRQHRLVEVNARLEFKLDLTKSEAKALVKRPLKDLSAGDIFMAPWEEYYVEEE